MFNVRAVHSFDLPLNCRQNGALQHPVIRVSAVHAATKLVTLEEALSHPSHFHAPHAFHHYNDLETAKDKSGDDLEQTYLTLNFQGHIEMTLSRAGCGGKIWPVTKCHETGGYFVRCVIVTCLN